MSRRSKSKKILKSFIEGRDWDGLVNWAEQEGNVLKYIKLMLYSPDNLFRWKAVEAMSKIAAFYSRTNMEKVREIIRQALWLMNDESGGLLWNGPEVIGSIIVEVPELIDDYGRILTSFLVEEPFERGTHWALSRIVSIKPELFLQSREELFRSLQSQDPWIRAYAFTTLKKLGEPVDPELVAALNDDGSLCEIYSFEQGTFSTISVAQIVQSGTN